MNRRSLTAVFACVLSLSAPLAAEGTDDLIDEVRAVLDLPSARDSVDYSSLQGCVTRLTPDAPAHADVTMTTAFPPVSGGEMPPARLIEPAPAEADITHLRQFLRIEAQLSACDDLRREAAGRRLTVQTEGDLLTVLADERFVPEPPRPPRAEDEDALGLDRPARREVQIRLDLAGHDPGTPDGVFGPRTRSAIRDWQQDRNLPASGYIDNRQLSQLTAQTEEDYLQYREEGPRQTRRRNSGSNGIYWGRDGCPRYANGNIVPSYSFKCDVKGTFQLP